MTEKGSYVNLLKLALFFFVKLLALRSPEDPELYVVAKVELQASEYHGINPFSVAELTDKVQIELVYPSQLQLS